MLASSLNILVFFQFIWSVIDTSNRPSTSQTCHQHLCHRWLSPVFELEIPIPFSVAFLFPLQYVCIRLFLPVQDEKLVNQLVEQMCLTFCLHVTDWLIRASSWSLEAVYLKVWLKQFGSVHRVSSFFGKICPSFDQSTGFKTVLPSDSVKTHSTAKAFNSGNGINTFSVNNNR